MLAKMGMIDLTSPHVWLVGISGTGKSTLAHHLMGHNPDLRYLSLSSFVRSLTADFNLAPTRDNFARVAAWCRPRLWDGFLATFAYGSIRASSADHPYIIDGIRHTSEIAYLKERLTITLIGINVADWDLLAQRIVARAKPTDNISPEGVRRTLTREWHSDSMNVRDCLPLCDIVIDNSWDLDACYQEIDRVRQSLFTALSY